MMGAAGLASAQGLRTAYFSDSYVYRHQMNPALANTSGYVAMPILGNMNMNLGLNFGIKDFIYKDGKGGLTTFMNKDVVSTGTFVGNLPDVAKTNLTLDMQIASSGFVAFGGYNTIDLGLHTRFGFALPKDLFVFMKEMASDKTYSFTDLNAQGMAWADIAFGHSRMVMDNLRVGAKVKLLFGLAYADARFNDCSATFGADSWRMSMKGDVQLAGGGYWTTDGDGLVDGYEDFTPGVNGFGMAFDLGATYDMKDLVDGLKLSAAITDLGWISWKSQTASTSGQPFQFDGFKNVALHEEDGLTLKQQWEGYDKPNGEHVKGIKDDLEAMYQLRPNADANQAKGIGATLTLGAEYELPMYKKISFGLLYTGRYQNYLSYNEGRINVNYAPSRLFDLSLSAAATTFGGTVGAMANLHCPGFDLFVGTDRFYTKSMNKDYIPLEKGGINVAMGIAVPFGF